MLYRVSGVLTDGRTFQSRIEGSNPIAAFVTGRKALNDDGVADESVSEIRCRAVKGGKSVRFGKPREAKPKAPATEKAPAAAGKSTPSAPAKK